MKKKWLQPRHTGIAKDDAICVILPSPDILKRVALMQGDKRLQGGCTRRHLLRVLCPSLRRPEDRRTDVAFTFFVGPGTA